MHAGNAFGGTVLAERPPIHDAAMQIGAPGGGRQQEKSRQAYGWNPRIVHPDKAKT
jgi:hypothetical protein